MRGIKIQSHNRLTAAVALGGLFLTSHFPVQAWAQSDGTEISFSAGVSYLTGDFGADQDTDIFFAPATIQFTGDRFRFVGTVPYIRIEGPGIVVGGPGGPIIIGSPGAGVTTESGIGDVVLSAYYLIDPGSEAMPYFEIGGTVKLPTANENKGLGTGKTDFAAHLDIFKELDGGTTPFATIGYRFRGDPQGLNLKNSVYASAGASFPVSEALKAGVSFEYEQKSIAGVDDLFEIVPFLSWQATDSLRFDFYASVGLTDSAADFSAGLSLRLSSF
ncbi:MAG: transporter [Proteobacteria bacterium]|nr:transporter [Pseudomonadota bacterium]